MDFFTGTQQQQQQQHRCPAGPKLLEVTETLYIYSRRMHPSVPPGDLHPYTRLN
jgi:hypothetical protein